MPGEERTWFDGSVESVDEKVLDSGPSPLICRTSLKGR